LLIKLESYASLLLKIKIKQKAEARVGKGLYRSPINLLTPSSRLSLSQPKTSAIFIN
jgi:hypothetical protein